jgi:endonuclease-3
MARSVTTVTRRPAGGGRARKAPDAIQVVERLARVFPGATTELRFTNAFELLTATILSAQFPDARALAAADAAELERLIKPTGFFRAKSRALIGMASQLVARHAGRVPASMDELVALTGVGRKTANVVLGHALGVPGLPVDRHVLRVANRLGIARAATPEGVEAQLCAALPDRLWTLASDCLILHGRRVCRPRPLCEKCVLSDVCVSANLVAPVTGRTRPAGAPTPASPRKSARRGGAPRSRKAR